MIKKLTLIAILSVFTYGSNNNFAKEMIYFTNYNSAIKYSKNTNKPIMLVVTSVTCPWCKKLENQILKKSDINILIRKNFVPVILNKDKDNFPRDKLKAKSVPTIFFINSETQDLFHETLGYKSKKNFIKEIEIAKKKYKQIL